MIEKHPFGDFVPKNTKYLLLGSFTGKRTELDIQNGYDWFYGTKRNQFWPIIREVYGLNLDTKIEKQKLFKQIGMAITDIILFCERRSNSNLDTNLINIILNDKVNDIFEKNRLKKVFFSSRFVEKLFRKYFKDLLLKHPKTEFVTLPSPSPRYAAMSRVEKIAKYKQILPRF